MTDEEIVNLSDMLFSSNREDEVMFCLIARDLNNYEMRKLHTYITSKKMSYSPFETWYNNFLLAFIKRILDNDYSRNK